MSKSLYKYARQILMYNGYWFEWYPLEFIETGEDININELFDLPKDITWNSDTEPGD